MIEDQDHQRASRRADWLIGLATYGSALAGGIGILVALVAAFDGSWDAAGICLIASAIAFGSLANALLRR